MFRIVIILIFLFAAAGCAKSTRNGVLSQQLPLTLDDIAEIKAGELNHEKVLWEYRIYESAQLQTYVNTIAANLAAVSTRPHLPYKVILLDSDEINLFGGPGGYLYITRGLFNFVTSESELAGAIAHEIAHVANYEYSGIPHLSKVKFVYSNLLRGSEMAKGAIGTYGTALNYGLKGVGQAAPRIAKRFSNDQEILADERAIDYLVKAGYDPRGFQKFEERLATVEMRDVNRFVIYMSTHPPFVDRRQALNTRIKNLALERGKIEFKKDLLAEIRQQSVNTPDSVVFEPSFGTHEISPLDLPQGERDKQDKQFNVDRRRWAWF